MSKPFGVTIFCDDIRREIGGKHTYVGVYGGGMNIRSEIIPASVPILSMAVMIFMPKNFKIGSARLIVVQHVGDSHPPMVLFSEEMDTLREGEKNRKHIINLSFSPFVVERDCTIRVKALFDETEVRLGSLLVRITQASVNPAEHSTS